MENTEDILNVLLSAMNNLSDKSDNEDEQKENTNDNSFLGGIDLDMIMKIGDIMSRLDAKDKDTELLLALKPYLKEKNQAKIDTAVKLFKLITLLPILRETGLFDNMF